MRTAEAQKALFARCISTSSGQYANAGLGRAAEIRSQNGIWSTNNLPTCLSPFSHLGFGWREPPWQCLTSSGVTRGQAEQIATGKEQILGKSRSRWNLLGSSAQFAFRKATVYLSVCPIHGAQKTLSHVNMFEWINWRKKHISNDPCIWLFELPPIRSGGIRLPLLP